MFQYVPGHSPVHFPQSPQVTFVHALLNTFYLCVICNIIINTCKYYKFKNYYRIITLRVKKKKETKEMNLQLVLNFYNNYSNNIYECRLTYGLKTLKDYHLNFSREKQKLIIIK